MTRIIIVLANVIVFSMSLSAQEGKIIANPEAVTLREIWRVRGAIAGGDRVGEGIGGGFDVNRDGIGDFAARFGKTGEWKVYLGSPEPVSDTAVWTFKSSGEMSHPIAGDFWNTGHPALAFPLDTCFINSHDATVCYFRLWIFRTESGVIADTPAAIVSPRVQPCVDAFAANLDATGGDELIVAYNCYRPEIWIYQGGRDFNVDMPTIKVIDTTETTQADRFYVAAGDLDGDKRLDLVTAGIYDDGAKLKFYFGSTTSPWSWSQPDRVIALSSDRHPRVGYGLTLLDVDGDRVADLLLPGPDGRIYLFRSRGTGKNARTRSYDITDGDNSYYTGGSLVPGGPGIPMNDASGRYDMMMLLGNGLMAFSGGPYGPDSAYEGTYRDGLGNVFALTRSIGDVNADGWSDYMTANFRWWGFDQGIALILAGGPYIPRDDTTLAVHDLRAEAHAGAISVWPNPARESVNIAWRGDLRRPPSHFEIHDLLGQRIASGTVEPSAGSVHWPCEGAPAGSYLLSVFDRSHTLIATTRFIIQH